MERSRLWPLVRVVGWGDLGRRPMPCKVTPIPVSSARARVAIAALVSLVGVAGCACASAPCAPAASAVDPRARTLRPPRAPNAQAIAPVDDTAARIAAVVEPLMATFGQPAVVVGVVMPSGDQVYGFGKVSADHPSKPTAATLFEIGSITKVFTGHLLADMALRVEVSLDDPAQPYLPGELVLPVWPGRPITLRDLATHRSGLGYLPQDMRAMRVDRGEQVPIEESNGHPTGFVYTRAHLARALGDETLSEPPGSRYRYSPFGFGLLGIALSERAGLPLAELFRERVFGPLGLRDTQLIGEARGADARFSEGHSEELGGATWFRTDEVFFGFYDKDGRATVASGPEDGKDRLRGPTIEVTPLR